VSITGIEARDVSELRESADAVEVTLIGSHDDDPTAGACPPEARQGVTEGEALLCVQHPAEIEVLGQRRHAPGERDARECRQDLLRLSFGVLGREFEFIDRIDLTCADSQGIQQCVLGRPAP
jgi:hypothetical protein